MQTKWKPKRVKALYNCVADNPDELTFSEGDVIVVDGEEDQEWWVSRGCVPRSLGLCCTPSHLAQSEVLARGSTLSLVSFHLLAHAHTLPQGTDVSPWWAG